MYKRIMVPLDSSELAEVALPYAGELAIRLDSEVILINVRTPGEDPDNPEQRIYLGKMAATLEQNMRKSSEMPPGQNVKVASTVIGSPGLVVHTAEEILDYADKENISLIVMATHGRTGIRRWALGSTTDKVVRAARCPVLLIRADIDVPRKVKLVNLLVPLDGSKQSEAVLYHVESLAARFKAKVMLLHVVVPPNHIYPVNEAFGYYGGAAIVKVPFSDEEVKPLVEGGKDYLKEIGQKLAGLGIVTTNEVRVGHAGEEIIKAADETGADVVAMSTHGESGFTRWEHGSTADKVLHAVNKPLLLVRERRE